MRFINVKILIIASCFLLNIVENTNAEQSYSFYDELRSDDVKILASLRESDLDRGRDIQIVRSPDGNGNLTLIHVPLMYDYVAAGKSSKSQGGGGGGDEAQEKENVKDYTDKGYTISAATLLGIHHFNNGIGSIVTELNDINKKCNVRLTTEIFDTREDPEVATKKLIDMISREHNNVKIPKPSAILGSSMKDVTNPMVQISSIYDLLQVSSLDNNARLDKTKDFSLFSRTNPSESTIIDPTVEFLRKEFNLSHLAIISFANSEGNEFRRGVSTIGDAKYNMTVFDQEYKTPEQLEFALERIGATGVNYIIGAMPSWRFGEVMTKAVEMNLAGPDSGKQWFFTEYSALDLFVDNKSSWKKGSAMDKACQGTAIIHNEVQEDTSTEKFYDEWNNIGKDQDLVDYINSKQPEPFADYLTYTRNASYFTDSPPSRYAAYAYDAAIALGLSACASINTNINEGEGEQNPYFFSGKQQKKEFMSLEFDGASGEIFFDQSGKTNSRDPFSFRYMVSNINGHEYAGGEMIEFEAENVFNFDPETQVWSKQDGRDFIFYDGTTVPPAQFLPLEEDEYSLTPGIRAYGYICAIICVVLSVVCMILTQKWKNKKVIRAAQPPFLIMIAFGTLMMSTSIFFISIDDGVASIKVASAACMVRLWTVSIGFCIVFAALYSKARRINRVMDNARSFKRVRVTPKDVMKPFALMLSCNVIILLVWTIVNPMVYKRKYDEEYVDIFGRVTESYGLCIVKDESGSALPYVLSLVIVNLVAMVAANVEVYKGRKIKTEFNEGKYIAVAMISILQALIFGVPVLFIAVEYRTAMFFVASSTIFVICMAILTVMFLPKFKTVLKPPPPDDRVVVSGIAIPTGSAVRAVKTVATSNSSSKTSVL